MLLKRRAKYSLSILWVLTQVVHGSHFYGATIRWKSDPNVPNKATFFWKAGWRIGRGPCGNTCDLSRVGSFGNVENPANYHNGYWKCHRGCTVAPDNSFQFPITYWITSVNADDDYEMGENTFEHTFASTGPFHVGFSSLAWRALNAPGLVNKPAWNVWTMVVFGERNDTGKPNNSPLTASLPVYKLQFNCDGVGITLPLVDPDGDTVKCRWGVSDEECSDVCNALPNVLIDPDTCTLSVNTKSANSYAAYGWYVATIILEDFPKTTIDMGGTEYTPSDALSKVPVQFLIQTPQFATGCSTKPKFIWPTPDQDTIYYVSPTRSMGINIYAVNEDDPTATITDIVVVSPPGVLIHELRDDDHGRTKVKYRIVYWTPDATQSGANTICFKPIDSNDKTGEYRCVYIYANDVDECAPHPCMNGGTCNNLENLYTCTCLPGTAGYNCTQDAEDNCASSPCQNGGTCYDDFNNFQCICPVGYTGSDCSIDINECASAPCLNGATCNDLVNGYTCNCIGGFGGLTCNDLADECDSSPCQNGGSCMDLLDEYLCVCAPGWQGVNCQININECSSSPCDNGATCNDGVNSYTCSCDTGYMGTFCERQVDDCLTAPCLNAGTCVDELNSYTCLCAAGFTGTTCHLNLDECLSTPCDNNATCVDGVNSYTCTCKPGYSGTFCQNDINECVSAPCQNSGRCYDQIDGYECDCSAGFSGLHCETNIDDCVGNVCAYGGTCIDGIDDFSCVCAVGFTGPTCNLTVNYCFSNPCKNGGTCLSIQNGYECRCHKLWYGTHCTSTNEKLCNCSEAIMPGETGFKVQCECAEDYTFSRRVLDIDREIPCLRNVWVLVCAFSAGFVLSSTVLLLKCCINAIRGRRQSSVSTSKVKLLGSKRTLDEVDMDTPRPPSKRTQISPLPSQSRNTQSHSFVTNARSKNMRARKHGRFPGETDAEEMKMAYLDSNKYAALLTTNR